MRLAVFSDVHGNRLALEAVLDDLRAASPDAVVNLGDCLAGPFEPAAAADLQMGLNAVTVAGNHERGVLQRWPNRLDAVAWEVLSPDHLAWLASLPAVARIDEVYACHGSPAGGDEDSLLDRIADGSSVLAEQDQIRSKLAGIGDAKVVLCGHSHLPRAAQVGDVLVLNPGSVGMPAFRLENPVPHAMEAGTPHARYATITRRRGSWQFQHHAVVYDWTPPPARRKRSASRPWALGPGPDGRCYRADLRVLSERA